MLTLPSLGSLLMGDKESMDCLRKLNLTQAQGGSWWRWLRMNSPSGPEKTTPFHVFFCSWGLLSSQCGPPSLPEALPPLHQGCGGHDRLPQTPFVLSIPWKAEWGRSRSFYGITTWWWGHVRSSPS